MNRREFVGRASLLGAAAGFLGLSGAWEKALAVSQKPSQSSLPTQDESNRSPGDDPLDPLAVQRSTLVFDNLDMSELDESYLRMLRAGGVDCLHRSVGGAGGGDIQAFADAYNFLDKHSDQIVPVATVREIRQAYQDGKIALVFGWQSANELEKVGGELFPSTALRAYYQLGLRIVGIAYQVANIFGGGCLEPRIGLTRAGRRLVEEIHNLRIALDVGGHTGEQASFDAIEMAPEMAVICSHTNLSALNDNPRCTSDRLIEAIAKTGGVIGLTAISDFDVRSRKDADIPHIPQATLDKHLDQYDYLRKLVGADHIGLAPDFEEGRPMNVSRLNRAVTPREMVGDFPWLFVKGFANITELPNVTRGLIQRGWSTGEIRKVLGENWLRVYRQIWGS